MERLRRYDIYAPIAASDRQIPYGDAVSSVLETFRGFHPTFARLAERIFVEDHVDSEIRKGKRGGAFCSTIIPRLTPWVMVNYDGRVRDVATLAHELGHAVHSMLAEHHTCFTQHASLPLAETASVFAEMLMTDRLLRAGVRPGGAAGAAGRGARRRLRHGAAPDLVRPLRARRPRGDPQGELGRRA